MYSCTRFFGYVKLLSYGLLALISYFCSKEPAEAQSTFSSSRDPTVWRTIPVLEYLQQSWESMELLPKFETVAPAIRAGIDNLSKWYQKTDDTDVYFICLGKLSAIRSSCRRILTNLAVLDPNVKLAYAEDKWDSDAKDDGVTRLETVVRNVCWYSCNTFDRRLTIFVSLTLTTFHHHL